MIKSLLRSAAGLAIAATATFITVVGSAAPVSASPVSAAQAPGTVAVYTKGIDLASPAGAARVKAEIRRAARRVCDDHGDRSVNAHQKRQQCIATAINAAMPRLDALVTAVVRTDLAAVPAPATTVRR